MLKILLSTALSLLIVSSLSADTYYWVGGTGNWSDISHWATTSGGAINHEVIPGAEDDVVFDQGSFDGPDQIITIDVANAICRNFLWTNAQNFPTINNLTSSTLTIHGDFVLIPQMNFNFNGSVVFRGAGNHNIQTFNHTLGGNVFFDDPEGIWNIPSIMNVGNVLYIRKGAATFLQDINCRYLHITPTDVLDNCAFNATGNILVSANNTTSGGNPFESVKLNADFVNLNIDANSEINLTGTNATIRVTGVANNIALPRINFSSNAGSQRVFADDGTNHQIAELIFGSNGRIDRSTVIGSLLLTGSKTYRFGANYDFLIQSLTAIGDCSNPIYLVSTSQGNRARFAAPGTVNGTFLNIRDIEVIAGNFQIFNAKNLGNTIGWNMSDIGSQELYWVGGTGNWQDQNNWSYTSGGPGGACIPTPIDDVYFDQNSFNAAGQSVSLIGEFSYCRNMFWQGVTNTPRMQFQGRSLNVSGSLTLSADMDLNQNGILRFDAFNGSHTITSAGHNLGTDVRLETIGGTYTMQDDMTIGGRLLHIFGNLNTAGFDLNLVEYYSNYGTNRALDITNSDVNVAGIPGRVARWEIGSNGFNLRADGSTINVGSGISLIHRGSGQLQFDKVLFSSTGNIYAYDGVDARYQYVSMASSSFVFANNQFDTLMLAPAQSYEFSSGSRQTIGRLVSIGDCDALINLEANVVGEEAIFFTDLDNSDVRYNMVKDIHLQGAGALRNIQGIDNGNTQGWEIPTNVGRDLYWVGNGGSWNDSNHWSAISGGPGGECIPTSLDNVFFDQNSFDQGGQVVSSGNIFFRDMSWVGVANNPAFSVGTAYTYGSIELVDAMDINSWGWIRLSGAESNRILDTRAKPFVHLELNALGSWSLASPINATGQFFIYNGGLNTQDQDIRAERFRIWERNNLNIDLTSSIMDLFGSGTATPVFAQYQNDNAELIFDPGTSVINIEHPSGYTLIGSNEVSLHNLNFLDESGRGYMDVRTSDRIAYNKVIFNGDGLILREHVMDTLIFAPGKTYTLHSNRTQIVNDHFVIMGSPCGPTTLQASSVGIPATIEKTNGPVVGDYINMRDQIGIGESFNAGQHSTNVGNSNEGWIFEMIDDTNPERGILGADQILCDDTSLALDAFTYTQNLTYNWDDGSTNNTRVVQDPGTYWVDVTFDANCTTRDTIMVLPQVYSQTDLGPDTTLCEGEILNLDVSINGGTYTWQDDSNSPMMMISSAGQYYVQVDYLGCPNSDTLIVSYDALPTPNLGVDRLACENEIITLSPNAGFETILWSNNATTDELDIDTSGMYWVEITQGVCAVRDSIEIQYFNLSNYLGPDTSFCAGDVLRLQYPGDGFIAFEWNDGSDGTTLEVNEEGTYSLRLTREQCEVYDEIFVAERPLPMLEMEREMSICEGTIMPIEPISNGDRFEWSNGDMTLTTNITDEGTYQLTAYLDDCPINDYITVFVDELPNLELGPDTTICVQRPLQITLSNTGTQYEWNDGSTFSYRTIDESGYYSVRAVNGACEIEDAVTVVAEVCREFQVYAPNIFSPDGDGVNDEFRPLIDPALEIFEYRLMIFDRWGGMVFETNDLEAGWDGTVNGQRIDRGSYVYTMEFSYRDELKSDRTTVSGDIMLVR